MSKYFSFGVIIRAPDWVLFPWCQAVHGTHSLPSSAQEPTWLRI